MIIKKTVKQEMNIDIKEVTLISTEEYFKYKDNIPNVYDEYCTRTPGLYAGTIDHVTSYSGQQDGLQAICPGGSGVDVATRIRPLLVTQENVSAYGLKIGDELEMLDNTWTVIAENLIFCNDTIGSCCFRKDRKADDSSLYEASDMKKYIDKWYKEYC